MLKIIGWLRTRLRSKFNAIQSCLNPWFFRVQNQLKICKKQVAEDLRKIGVAGMGVGLFGFFMPQNLSVLGATVILFLSLCIWVVGLYLTQEGSSKED